MRRIVAILAVGLAVAAARADDGPVTVKVMQLGPGEKVKETKTETTTNKVSFTVMGTDMVKDEKVVTRFVYTEEVVTKPAGAKRPTKLKRTYETAEMTKDGAPEELGLAGKTLVIEKAATGYDVTLDGKELTGPAATILKKEFGKDKQVNDEDLLPQEPVKVGGTWKVDVTKLAKDAEGELDIDVAKSSASGKLVKVYDKGGHKFGVLEITMELALNKIGGEGQQIEMKPGSKMKVTAVMDTCIDGSKTAFTGKVTVKGEFTGTTMGIDLTFNLTSVKEGGGEEVGK
jgi:hypothetical protein